MIECTKTLHVDLMIITIIYRFWEKQILIIYGIGGTCHKAAESFYIESRACVKGELGMSQWFGVEVGMSDVTYVIRYVYGWSCLRRRWQAKREIYWV